MFSKILGIFRVQTLGPLAEERKKSKYSKWHLQKIFIMNGKQYQLAKIYTKKYCYKPIFSIAHKCNTFVFYCRRLRFIAYRSLVSWCWGSLGARVRVVIPACAVTRIRHQWPNAEGQYVGFRPVGAPVEVRFPLDQTWKRGQQLCPPWMLSRTLHTDLWVQEQTSAVLQTFPAQGRLCRRRGA